MFVRTRGGGSPVVWIHGLGESGLCFEGVAAHARLGSWRHLLPDMPGYGRSAWPPVPLGLQGTVDHLAGWLRQHAATPVWVVGHSLGGVLAILLAERHPGVVRGLVDVDGNLSSDDCVFSAQAEAWSLDPFIHHGFEVLCQQVYRGGVEDKAQRGYYASLRLADPRTFHRHATELVALSRAGDLARRLAGLPVPHRYIAGVPRGVSPGSRSLLRRAGVASQDIQPAGHWPFIDQADAFATALARFLTATVGGA